MHSKKTNITALLLALVIALAGCIKNNPPKRETQKRGFDEKYIKINKQLVTEYQKIIKAYIKRQGWQMDSTGTGMWYEIYEKTGGYIPKDGDKVTIAYKVYLLNGKLCYSSDSSGVKTFTVNHSAVISGLNDAVQLMPEGSKARFIIPPYRAYGLTGDGKCVPPNSIIIYDIQLLEVQKAKSH